MHYITRSTALLLTFHGEAVLVLFIYVNMIAAAVPRLSGHRERNTF